MRQILLLRVLAVIFLSSCENNTPAIKESPYEYSIEILVSPVMEKVARTREIIFPEGSWKGDDGSVVKGPVSMEVKAALERLPWYRKQSN